MAPSNRIAPNPAPETLPEDFADWDGQSSSDTLPVEANGHGAEADSHVHSDYSQFQRPATPPPANVRASTAPQQKAADGDLDVNEFLKRLKEVRDDRADRTADRPQAAVDATKPRSPSLASPTDAATMPAPVPEQASTREADQELIQLFRSGYKEAEETKPETAKKTNWKLIGGLCAGAVVIVLAILIPMEMRGKPANSSSTSVPSVAAAASVDQGAGAPKPSPSAPVTVPVRANTTPQSTTTSSQQASYNNEEASAPAVQSQLMSDQLNAPRRIPKGANTRVPDEAPPPAGNLDGLGGSGSIGNAFNDGSKSKIRLASVPVSAGIAGGMLIRRFPPVYPSIAKAAHVSGTVVLAATISKSGTIQNLRVVSGPAMLRQAAVEAVQKWVYRPYLLDNQPTEMDTTIDVDFSQ